ncbi:Plant calmodulin-binding domain-containing protein [Carex littledalei]|uniref:Plant calmodulin-binding domain-containing protein n=1 Tax=Carex littledalei TaxID=544730 RepID=A0A833VAB7_9POAL|nr:Plant calmodulin-binding domain-containing protein [Carex littledalei]
MMRGRPPVKSKPQTESGRERSLSGNGTGRSGHVQNVSGSTIDGNFSNTKLKPESPGARKDQLQITSKKSHANALTRSSSTRSEATTNRDLNNIKKPVERHYMKTTRSFNAKSQNPVDLDSPKVKKKPDPDPYGVRRKSENIRDLQSHKPRSRSSSGDFQSTPMLKRSPSINSLRVPRQNRQEITKQAGKKKDTKGETEAGSFTSDHLSYTENGEGVVDQIIKDESSYLHSNKQQRTLDIDGTEIKTDMVSRTSIKDEMEHLEETGDSDLSFNPEIKCGYENSEKLEVICKNLPEIKTKETIMEGSPKHADSNVEVLTENKILERYEVTEEKISEIEMSVAESFPPEIITSDKDENCEKHEVIDTKYEEIDDICVFSSSNDEADDLGEISTEDELSKIMGTESTHFTEQEHNETADLREFISIEDELSKTIGTKNTHCTEQEQNETADLREISIEDKLSEIMGTEITHCTDQEQNETTDPHEISIEDELSKVIGTENTHCTEQEQNETADLRELSIEDELSKIIGTENTHYTEQEQIVLPIDIVSIIEEIVNELEGMEKHPAGGNGDAMHPTWSLKKWKVDYVLQRLIQKLEATDKNKVSTLIKAFECVIPLMMRRMGVPYQASS